MDIFINETNHINWELLGSSGGMVDYIYLGVKLGIYPPLIFLGIGTMTDFEPLIARPSSLLLGAAGSALFLVLQKRTSDPESVNISWGGVACLVMIPLILLHSGSKAPTQSLLGQIATAVGPLDKPFTRTDLHKQAW